MDMMQYFASPHVIVLQFLAVDTVDFFYTMKGNDQKGSKGPKETKRNQKEAKGIKTAIPMPVELCMHSPSIMTKHLHLSALYPSHGHLYACVTKYSLCNSLFHEEI